MSCPADVVELVDTHVWGACGFGLASSSLAIRIHDEKLTQSPLNGTKDSSFAVVFVSNGPGELHTWVKPLFAVNKGHAAKHLGMTNIHPMVFVDLTPHDSDTVLRLATIAKTSPRTVIFCGDPKIVIPKHIERLETNLSSLTTLQDLISLPLEHLGSYVLSKYCKGTRSFEKVA